MLAKNQNVGARWIHSSAKPAYVIVCSLKREKAQLGGKLVLHLFRLKYIKRFQFQLNAAKLWHSKPTRIGVESLAKNKCTKCELIC